MHESIKAADDLQARASAKLAVHAMPGSAHPDGQLRAAGIDAKAIEVAAIALINTEAGY